MAESAAADMIKLHLDDERGLQRLPFGRALCAPATRPAGRPARETSATCERLQLLGERGTLGGFEPGTESDMVKHAGIVIQPEEERTDDALLLGVTKSADHAVRRASRLDLHHGRALAGRIRRVDSLRDHTIE